MLRAEDDRAGPQSRDQHAKAAVTDRARTTGNTENRYEWLARASAAPAERYATARRSRPGYRRRDDRCSIGGPRAQRSAPPPHADSWQPEYWPAPRQRARCGIRRR